MGNYVIGLDAGGGTGGRLLVEVDTGQVRVRIYQVLDGDAALVRQARQPAGETGGPPGRQDPRQELVQAIHELFQAQLVTATGGNLSMRIEGKDEAWITPSQLFKGDLKPEVMVRIDLEGNALDEQALPASSERLVHTEIYKARPDVQAIVHAHAPYVTILGLSDKPFLPITTEAAFIRELPRVPFIMAGTRELALAVAKALGDNPAVLMQNHGLVVAASSMRRALNLVEVVERTSQLILGCYAVGKQPPCLPPDVLEALREVGKLMG